MPGRSFAAALFIVCVTFCRTPEAVARCYEKVGCTDRDRFSQEALSGFNCRLLAFLRNSVYGENGYCFKSPEYSAVFLKETCRFDSAADVPLSEAERTNIAAIVEAEQAKGCR